jgi:type III pantothenate kinase
MTPDVVVDIGNTRMKWGRCYPDGIPGLVSLAPEDPGNWDLQAAGWNLTGPVAWAVASVHPERLKQFVLWATSRGDRVRVIEHAHIPLRVDVDEPEKVGIDRLLNAVAARARCPGGEPVVIIDAGSAVTVDWLDEASVFRGGAILPGPRLMTRALHAYTAKLPDVALDTVLGYDPPGRNTRDAITVGVMAAITGACAMLVDEYAALGSRPPTVLMTGGAIGCLIDFDFAPGTQVGGPYPLTLEGIRLAAEGLS